MADTMGVSEVCKETAKRMIESASNLRELADWLNNLAVGVVGIPDWITQGRGASESEEYVVVCNELALALGQQAGNVRELADWLQKYAPQVAEIADWTMLEDAWLAEQEAHPTT